MPSTFQASPRVRDLWSHAISASRLAGLRTAVQARVADYVAHHGMWAPGVRLMRNLCLRGKTIVLGAAVALPLALLLALAAMHELDELAQMRQGRARLELIRHCISLQRAIEPWWWAEVQQVPGTQPLQGMRNAEQAAYERLSTAAQLQRPGAGSVAALQSLAQRREAALVRLAGPQTGTLPGREPPRADALAAYIEELLAFRAGLSHESGIEVEASDGARSLARLASTPLSRLRWMLSQTSGIGLPLHGQADTADRAIRARRLMVAATRAGVMLQELVPEFEHSVSQALLDRPLIDGLRSRVQAHVDRAMDRGSELAVLPAEAPASPAASDEFMAASRGALQAVDAVEDSALVRLSAWAEARHHAEHRRYGWAAAGLGLWLLIALYLMASAYRVLAGGLDTLCRHLVRLGHGDLSRRPAGYGRDEIGSALKALGTSMGRMSELFGAVTQGVAAVSQASREVATGNVGLSARTGDVKSLISGVAQRAEACSQALDSCGNQVERTAELMVDMRADGERGRKAMSGMRESMARLQGKSRQIGQVVGLVESLAYQTRLLSINASVEAARAGPAGRGFSVVAHEVRALALRSEQAAQRIGGIVVGSIDEIELGVTLSERADDAVRRNEETMESVNSLMREAVTLTRTGRSESQEVLAISRTVEETIAGNSRVIDQLAQASASLRLQGDSLKRSVQHFVFD